MSSFWSQDTQSVDKSPGASAELSRSGELIQVVVGLGVDVFDSKKREI